MSLGNSSKDTGSLGRLDVVDFGFFGDRVEEDVGGDREGTRFALTGWFPLEEPDR